MISCPCCMKKNSQVLDSRPSKGVEGIRRRRQCVCGTRFTTLEVYLTDTKGKYGVSHAYSKLLLKEALLHLEKLSQ